MVKDRLIEFQEKSKLSSKNRGKNDSVRLHIDEIIESFDLLEDNPAGIERFLEEIKNLNDMMERMEENMISISEFQDLILESPLDDLNLLKDYSALVDLFKTNLYSFNNTLKEFMNHEISLNKNDGKATFRIRKNQMMTTNKKFLDLMIKFNDDQASYLERSEQYKNFYLKISKYKILTLIQGAEN
uniref:Syntaxin N-terminal domain-containing protein n=1 Tax=Acrobeloides nanus TaxID=290746 RepID=A0A914ENK4_9BILA